jgi:hypothetical protein
MTSTTDRFEIKRQRLAGRQRLADLNDRAAELQRELAETQRSLAELAQSAVAAGAGPAAWAFEPEDVYADAADLADAWTAVPAGSRTGEFVSRGRPSAYRRRLWQSGKALLATAIGAAVVAAAVVLMWPGPGASWPPGVARVQAEAATACQNPDVKSEPGQVNFACAKARQILWVFALLTSHDNPDYASVRSGRQGLEPITPAQGGEIAWSLNLHHPYNPANPLDSLAVAARAINNIVGGATVTSANGSLVIQPGLESSPADCLRYTGSAAVTAHRGFPGLCARPVTTTGQAALVADIFQHWMPGASAQTANDAAVLVQNAGDPGNPQVQVILRQVLTPGYVA